MPSDPHAAWTQAVRDGLRGLLLRPEMLDAALRTALASLDRAGFVLAPKEATPEMIEAGWPHTADPCWQEDVGRVHAAMLAARPAMPPEDPPHA